jgi:CheY-like chemotaxis protein
MPEMLGKDVRLLLVEDDVVDVMALKRALQRHKLDIPLTVARDGIEAIEILRGSNDREPLPRPYIILLDLNLPRMNGLEFLHALRANSALQDAIVFVLTTSKADEDKRAAYRLQVAGYIVKSDLTDSLFRVVTMLEHYVGVVELP